MSFTLIKRSNLLMDFFSIIAKGTIHITEKKHSIFFLFILQVLWEYSGSLYKYIYNLMYYTILLPSVNPSKFFCDFLLLPALNETCGTIHSKNLTLCFSD